jgi:hypothetical protein
LFDLKSKREEKNGKYLSFSNSMKTIKQSLRLIFDNFEFLFDTYPILTGHVTLSNLFSLPIVLLGGLCHCRHLTRTLYERINLEIHAKRPDNSPLSLCKTSLALLNHQIMGVLVKRKVSLWSFVPFYPSPPFPYTICVMSFICFCIENFNCSGRKCN